LAPVLAKMICDFTNAAHQFARLPEKITTRPRRSTSATARERLGAHPEGFGRQEARAGANELSRSRPRLSKPAAIVSMALPKVILGVRFTDGAEVVRDKAKVGA